MLRPTAIKVMPLANHKLLITFDNAEVRIFDVSPYIKGSWYGKLGDNSYFKSVSPDGFTVVWPDGQDICPDDLYYSSKPVLNRGNIEETEPDETDLAMLQEIEQNPDCKEFLSAEEAMKELGLS